MNEKIVKTRFRKIKKGTENYPLRKVVNRYQNAQDQLSEVLECGHHIIAELYENGEKIYLQEAKKRKCKECYDNKKTFHEELKELNDKLRKYNIENNYNKCPCCNTELKGEIFKDDSSYFVICPECRYDVNLWKIEPFYSEHMRKLKEMVS